MSFPGYLKQPELNELTQAAIDGNLLEIDREILMQGIAPSLVLTLKKVSSDLAQFTIDLGRLNNIPPPDVKDDLPLQIFLTNAANQLRLRSLPQAEVFEHYKQVASDRRAAAPLNSQSGIDQRSGASPIKLLGAMGSPRAVTDSVFLAYADVDRKLSEEITKQLLAFDRSIRTVPQALLSKTDTDFEILEASARRCHTSIVVLSQSSLSQLTQPDSLTAMVLSLLRDRTGNLTIIWQGNEPPEIPNSWPTYTLVRINSSLSDATIALDNEIKCVVPPEAHTAIGLPFIVLAMTQSEAHELLDEPHEALSALDADRRAQFLELRSFLKETGASSIYSRYGARRDQWIPFLDSTLTAWGVIDEAVRGLNATGHPGLGQRFIKPQYYSFDALINQEEETLLSPIYDDIAKTGCIVLADELSLFHRTIRSAFTQSYLFNSDHALVTISPFDTVSTARRLFDAEFRRELRTAFRRFEREYDAQCEFGISNRTRLARWFYNSLPLAIVRLKEPPPDPGKMRQFFSNAGLRANRSQIADYLYSHGTVP
ncbi:hypothetical protein CT676_27780 [Bradyrhizobium sp. MOS001]|uniref:hypothetical protein n=1 Tax=Bradyrhizobium sp. MOS001 TaxID=2133948 RepID=UPI00107516E3|nr:hypothetical protein [Bradyrhizobium sp. MOS001]TFW57806.1 hypothetical protein CT676_27780 [Bradyrhizobium sp. MOS001]